MRTTRARAFKAIVATTASIFFMPAAAWASTIINLPTTTNITVEAGETLFVDYLVGGTTLTKSGAGRMEVAVIGNPDLTVIVNEGTFATAKASTLDLSENENVIFHLDANKTSALPSWFRSRIAGALGTKWFNRTNALSYASLSVASGASLQMPNAWVTANELSLAGTLEAREMCATNVTAAAGSSVVGRLVLPDGAALSVVCGEGGATPCLEADETVVEGSLAISVDVSSADVSAYDGTERKILGGTVFDASSASVSRIVLPRQARKAGLHAEPRIRADGVYAAFSLRGSCARSSEGAKRIRSMNAIALLVMGGLWQLRFADGSLLDPSSCSVSTNGVGDVVYSSPEAMVAIRRTPVRGGFDLRGCVVSRGKTVKDFMLPARTGFDPEKIDRVAFPGKKFMGTGYSLKAEFFKRQTDTKRCAWEGVQVKGFGHRQVFGGGSAMRPLRDTPVPVVAAPGAEAFLGAEALSVVTNARFAVNRAPLTGQDCRVIVDSENGPLLCGLSLGGSGAVWRVCSASSADGEKARLALLRGCVRGILRESEKNRSERRKIALVRFPSHSGKIGFCPVPLASLRKMLREECGERFAYSELKSPQDIATAEASPDTLLVVNSYTETLPAENAADAPAAAERLKRYVRGGGHWLEPGGLSFFKAMVPREWMSIGGDYPGLFADFVHWKWKDGGTCTMMGVQPRPPHKPWGCPKPFVPGTLRIGGAVSGGWVEHGFCAWVRKGEKWLSPTVRVVTNLTLEAACDEYVRANTMDRPLSDKVRDASKLAVLKRAPLLFLGDGAAKCMAAIPHIPVPSIIHQSQYLKGGFDKEYPDHLPPRASYGTQEEMRAFVDALHAAGHFFSPYTNPTWWCDHPRGPTFLAAGEDPISLDEKGSPVYRYYGPNADGWSVCFWHSAVQAANRSTRRKFTVDVPCDILFQDECGARHQRYDFNEAAPHPTAYLEGMISMLEEDSQEIPLATEDGWDRVAREETALCGLSWGTVPLKETSILEKAKIPPHLWDIEAIPGRLFHDKCLFFLHDLGGFVNNDRSLAWCIALGYQLSYRCNAWHFTHDARAKAWYAKLHKIQQRIVARYAGRKLLSFRHDRSPLLARDDIEASSLNDDGVVLAEYEGGLRLAVNLGEVARTVDGCALPPYGFAELPAKQAKGGK